MMRDKENKSIMRVSIASSKPTWRALFCWFFANLEERMEIKMILSIPSTISSKVSVMRAAQSEGSENSSIMKFPLSVIVDSKLIKIY
jgi:hypothetical protein